MKELTIRRTDPRRVINEVAYSLAKVSKLYGYKLPGPREAEALTKLVINNFAFLAPSEIEKAFEMVATNKLNINIEAYGRILVVPIITKVLTAYRVHKNKLNQVDEDRGLKGDELRLANINARLLFLDQLKDDSNQIRLSHYNLIDQYIERFPSELKIDTYNEEIKKEIIRLKSLKPNSRSESLAIRSILNDNSMIDSTAKINAKVRLAKEYVFGSVIDYNDVRDKIINELPLHRIEQIKL